MSMEKYRIINVRDCKFVNFFFNNSPNYMIYVIRTITAIIKELIHYVYSYYYIYIIWMSYAMFIHIITPILYKWVTLSLFILLPLYYIYELPYVYSYYYIYII